MVPGLGGGGGGIGAVNGYRASFCRIFIGRIDAEAETQILWPPDVKS